MCGGTQTWSTRLPQHLHFGIARAAWVPIKQRVQHTAQQLRVRFLHTTMLPHFTGTILTRKKDTGTQHAFSSRYLKKQHRRHSILLDGVGYTSHDKETVASTPRHIQPLQLQSEYKKLYNTFAYCCHPQLSSFYMQPTQLTGYHITDSSQPATIHTRTRSHQSIKLSRATGPMSDWHGLLLLSSYASVHMAHTDMMILQTANSTAQPPGRAA